MFTFIVHYIIKIVTTTNRLPASASQVSVQVFGFLELSSHRDLLHSETDNKKYSLQYRKQI